MKILARLLASAALALGGVGLSAAPAQALDCTWDGSLGDTLVSGVGYVDLDLTYLDHSSVCVSTGLVGVYVEYLAADVEGTQTDTGLRLCVFTPDDPDACANPLTRVKVGIGNDDLAGTGAMVSLGTVWVEVLNGPSPTIRIWVNDTPVNVDVPGRCVDVVGSSGCP